MSPPVSPSSPPLAASVTPPSKLAPELAPGTKSEQGTLILVKRTEQEFNDWICTEAGFMETFGRYADEPLKFEPYQLFFLNTLAPFRCIEKSRQVGYSWVFACEALARSHLRETHTSVFVSYNLADAKEKMAYCQQMHEELPLEYQKKRVTDSKLEVAFQSNSASKKISRIISNPSKAPRGKTGDIYLDELAHCANDREIYKGSTALILRSNAQLTVCSSPLGRRGIFWEIARQEIKRFPAFWRQAVPWWLCGFFCHDIHIASRLAPTMSTYDRVQRFGKDKIKDQFVSLPLEDFQQEFEVFYSDEAMTFFPYELILPCTDPDMDLASDIGDVARQSYRGGRVVAGYDVGRRRDFSALIIMEEEADGGKRLIFKKEYDRVPFADQLSNLKAALTMLPIARLSIDANGIGMNLAENLMDDFAAVVVAEDSTMASKEVWCTDTKILMQRRRLLIPRDRDLISQIHSIKKNVTPGGRVTFEAEASSAKGHADSYWALAMACKKERGEVRGGSAQAGIRVIG